jgi:uncharacterized protein YuzE
METLIETYTTPDERYTVLIEVDWNGKVISVTFEENYREEFIYE